MITRAKSAKGNEATQMFYQKVGENIKEIRKTRGLTLQDVADRSGLTAKTIQRYERGEIKIDINRVADLAKALNVEVYELMKDADRFLLSESESGRIDLLRLLEDEGLPIYNDGELLDEKKRKAAIQYLSLLREQFRQD